MKSNGTQMEKKKLEFFKKVLEDRRLELRRSVARTEEDGRQTDETEVAQDVADRASNSYTKEFLFNRSAGDRQLLQLTEAALQRIREGTFGECVSCGNEINSKRLEAVPWAQYCIACQEKIEKGELQGAQS